RGCRPPLPCGTSILDFLSPSWAPAGPDGGASLAGHPLLWTLSPRSSRRRVRASAGRSPTNSAIRFERDSPCQGGLSGSPVHPVVARAAPSASTETRRRSFFASAGRSTVSHEAAASAEDRAT